MTYSNTCIHYARRPQKSSHAHKLDIGAVQTVQMIPNAELAVIPSASHFAIFVEQERAIQTVTR